MTTTILKKGNIRQKFRNRKTGKNFASKNIKTVKCESLVQNVCRIRSINQNITNVKVFSE